MRIAIVTDPATGNRFFCDTPSALWETVAAVLDCSVQATDASVDALLREPVIDHGDHPDRDDS